MIGGSYTQHSSDTVTLAALNSLMAEWDRTDVSLLTTKISHLEGANHLGTAGGRNGSYDLYTGTVTLDSGAYAVALRGQRNHNRIQAAETTGSSQIPRPGDGH